MCSDAHLREKGGGEVSILSRNAFWLLGKENRPQMIDSIPQTSDYRGQGKQGKPSPSLALFTIHFSLFSIFYLLFIITSCSSQVDRQSDRYVVLSPEIAEILAALDLSTRIVGRTAECDYPPELEAIEVIGHFGQVSLERIVALNPSIVFTTALEQGEITSQLGKLGIKTRQFYPKSPQDLLEMIGEIGYLCEREAEAAQLCEYLSVELVSPQGDCFGGVARSDLALTKHPTIQQPNDVYIEIYGDPIMSADNSSYLGQLLLIAGFENIFPHLDRDYCRVNAEDVVQLNPNTIIITYPGVTAEDVAMRKGWSEIRAVKRGRVFTTEDIDPDLILRAGPRNVEGIKRLREILNDEIHL